MVAIRPYTAADWSGVVACLAERQDHEASVETNHLPGAAVAPALLASALDDCRQRGGVVLVAATGAEVLGFVCVLPDEDFGELHAVPARAAYVSDLAVRASHRRGGLGGHLMRAAEEFAHGCGATLITVGVLATNHLARSFYAGCGYREYEVLLTKPLPGGSPAEAEPGAAADGGRKAGPRC